MRLKYFLRIGAAAALISIVPSIARSGMIGGTIKGSTVSAPALTKHPEDRDDINIASTFDISFFTYCPFIVADAARFPAYNLVFASLQPGSQPFAPPVGMTVAPVDASDFTISQYLPWVVDNNPAKNFVIDPAGDNNNRQVFNKDAGGANIVISYKPRSGDPTKVNFVQAYVEDINGAAFALGTIDVGSDSTSPYYNDLGVSGTGTTGGGGVPLQTDSKTPAWMVDIPMACENGPIPPGASRFCADGVDETLLSENRLFQTFIESDQTCSDPACGVNRGKVYQVLYGGVQWGYEYQNMDTPEPSSGALCMLALASAWLLSRYRSRSVGAL